MVKKVLLIIIFFTAFVIIQYIKQPAEANSFNDIIIGTPPEYAGEYIATVGGWNLI